jgi:hypothetical protein
MISSKVNHFFATGKSPVQKSIFPQNALLVSVLEILTILLIQDLMHPHL